ncbi:hypothetical protein [Actinoplanes sp. NPDC048796]|uniref:hypothetical protein n=1 Tax=unclassified Actinoplanes TaxID=2626549 RepID=UPI0033C7A1A7
MTKLRLRTAAVLALLFPGLAVTPAPARAAVGPLHGCQANYVCVYLNVNFNSNRGPDSSWYAPDWLAGCGMIDLGRPINLRNAVDSVVNNTSSKYLLLDHKSANHSADVGLGLMAPHKGYSSLLGGNNKLDEIVSPDCV